MGCVDGVGVGLWEIKAGHSGSKHSGLSKQNTYMYLKLINLKLCMETRFVLELLSCIIRQLLVSNFKLCMETWVALGKYVLV